MPFVGKLRMEHVDGTETYKLLESLIYITRKKEKRVTPKDFVSDGHSIPRALRSLAGSPFATKYPKSAWKHDYECETGIIPRKQADKEYKEAMADEGASGFQQGRNYVGVRTGAFFNWLSGFWKSKKKKK